MFINKIKKINLYVILFDYKKFFAYKISNMIEIN